MNVKHLLPLGFVDAFDECILCGFSGLDVCQGDLVVLGPFDKLVGDELGTPIEADLPGQSAPLLELVEYVDDPLGRQECVHCDGRALARSPRFALPWTGFGGDRNVLFGVFAVQLRKVTPQEIMAAAGSTAR